MKTFIVKEICKIRLVALGMDLNAQHIRSKIYYKPLTLIEKYFQEIGQAGREMVYTGSLFQLTI